MDYKRLVHKFLKYAHNSDLTMLHYFFRFSFALIAGVVLGSSGSATVGQANGQLVGSSVTLDYGTFNGFANASTGIIYFRGVRFADAPIGDLRWRSPVSPPTKHLGIVNATQFADACIETAQITVSPGTSEDCLFGNVFIPIGTHVDDKIPVMIWFHGGGYQLGNTHNAPPELIMGSSSRPLIFVSFEYRLGQFGFLGGTEISKNGELNAGFLDQRAALQWGSNGR
ncbi:hypothetical protein HYPSUDRAFT_828864 [Hypholoma sublateritium FD-334 SS-4]|uniref:Carboxylesterase type B domain-containing protein n=1 Tax=Hypholoma sublateritium (strain FD-334 SS-4) TaxID=945553 RepID=A0A0D2L0A0_HYPSF|nr:hypothetical protein HYPSUDRAFT_828864 [Hypholoma sublateritium FD-334 SS-4]